jgi:hypothetical protein
MTEGAFIHRPISVTVEKVTEMDVVRDFPAAKTQVIVNAKMDQAAARQLILLLLPKVLADEPVDLVTFNLIGTLK